MKKTRNSRAECATWDSIELVGSKIPGKYSNNDIGTLD